MADSSFQVLATSVENLKNDMAKIGLLVDRLDVTIEKLTEVSANVTQLLAIHGSRLEFQERIQEKLSAMMETRRQETETALEKVHNKIDKVQADTREELSDLDQSMSDKFDDIKNLLTTQHESHNAKISKLETWMWTVMGGATVLIFLIDKLDISKLF